MKTRRSEERRELETSGVKSVRNIQRPDGRSTISWCLGRCPGLAASCLPFVKTYVYRDCDLSSSGNCSVNSRLEINQIVNCLVDGSVMCAFKCWIFIVVCLLCEAIFGYSHEPKVKLGISYVAYSYISYVAYMCALFVQQHWVEINEQMLLCQVRFNAHDLYVRNVHTNWWSLSLFSEIQEYEIKLEGIRASWEFLNRKMFYLALHEMIYHHLLKERWNATDLIFRSSENPKDEARRKLQWRKCCFQRCLS